MELLRRNRKGRRKGEGISLWKEEVPKGKEGKEGEKVEKRKEGKEGEKVEKRKEGKE